MKHLIQSLLCFIFLHDFHTLDDGNGIKLIGCHRCAGHWQVDMRKQEVELVKEEV